MPQKMEGSERQLDLFAVKPDDDDALSLIGRLEQGELLIFDLDKDIEGYFARVIEGRMLECVWLGDDEDNVRFDFLIEAVERKVERGELETGPYCSCWKLPS